MPGNDQDQSQNSDIYQNQDLNLSAISVENSNARNRKCTSTIYNLAKDDNYFGLGEIISKQTENNSFQYQDNESLGKYATLGLIISGIVVLSVFGTYIAVCSVMSQNYW